MIMKYGKMLASHRKKNEKLKIFSKCILPRPAKWRWQSYYEGKKNRSLINISVNSLKIYHDFFHHKRKLNVFQFSSNSGGYWTSAKEKFC